MDGVRQALTDLELSSVELAVVEHRLTCQPGKKLSHKDLAKKLKISAPEVSRLEKSLVAKLRSLLN